MPAEMKSGNYKEVPTAAAVTVRVERRLVVQEPVAPPPVVQRTIVVEMDVETARTVEALTMICGGSPAATRRVQTDRLGAALRVAMEHAGIQPLSAWALREGHGPPDRAIFSFASNVTFIR